MWGVVNNGTGAGIRMVISDAGKMTAQVVALARMLKGRTIPGLFRMLPLTSRRFR